MGKNVHLTHRGDGNWAVITEGSERADSLHDTQAKTVERAHQIAENNQAELVIRDRQNRIRDKDSFGNDLFPPRDRKH